MRFIVTVSIVAALVSFAALAEPEPEPRSFRDIVADLEGWVKAREKDDELDEEPLKEIQGHVAELAKLDAKALYESLSPEERKKLRELLDRDERLEGYADRVVRIADDVGLDAEEFDTLLELYSDHREKLRKVWRDRDAREKAEEEFEKAVAKAFGRKKAKAIANAIRRTSRRGR